MHQLHHSRDPAFHNRNYGVILSIWDRLFGTYMQPIRNQTYEFGIDGRSGTSTARALFGPFAEAGASLATSTRTLRSRVDSR